MERLSGASDMQAALMLHFEDAMRENMRPEDTVGFLEQMLQGASPLFAAAPLILSSLRGLPKPRRGQPAVSLQKIAQLLKQRRMFDCLAACWAKDPQSIVPRRDFDMIVGLLGHDQSLAEILQLSQLYLERVSGQDAALFGAEFPVIFHHILQIAPFLSYADCKPVIAIALMQTKLDLGDEQRHLLAQLIEHFLPERSKDDINAQALELASNIGHAVRDDFLDIQPAKGRFSSSYASALLKYFGAMGHERLSSYVCNLLEWLQEKPELCFSASLCSRLRAIVAGSSDGQVVSATLDVLLFTPMIVTEKKPWMQALVQCIGPSQPSEDLLPRIQALKASVKHPELQKMAAGLTQTSCLLPNFLLICTIDHELSVVFPAGSARADGDDDSGQEEYHCRVDFGGRIELLSFEHRLASCIHIVLRVVPEAGHYCIWAEGETLAHEITIDLAHARDKVLKVIPAESVPRLSLPSEPLQSGELLKAVSEHIDSPGHEEQVHHNRLDCKLHHQLVHAEQLLFTREPGLVARNAINPKWVWLMHSMEGGERLFSVPTRRWWLRMLLGVERLRGSCAARRRLLVDRSRIQQSLTEAFSVPRHALLDAAFRDEAGVGSGPTLEFYQLGLAHILAKFLKSPDPETVGKGLELLGKLIARCILDEKALDLSSLENEELDRLFASSLADPQLWSSLEKLRGHAELPTILDASGHTAEEYIAQYKEAYTKTWADRQSRLWASLTKALPEAQHVVAGVAEIPAWLGHSSAACQIEFGGEHGYLGSEPPVCWLNELLPQLDRRLLLSFLTGASSTLQSRLRISVVPRDGDDSVFPSVMTCALNLKCPRYSSKQVLLQKLQYAIHEGRESFDLT